MTQNYSILHTPKFITGRGSISFIATLGRNRIGVIRGGRSLNDAFKTKIEQLAYECGAELCYLAQIRNEPFIDDIFMCMDKVRSFEPDIILAIGGGSVLDTAKAIHLFYENPDMSFEDALIPFSLPKLGKKAIHISVPTTCGTGSEATSAAVFIDPKTHTKKLLMDNTLIPHYAILDSETTDYLPDSIMIATGMDALTHGIEASTAKNASSLSRAIAVEAVLDIFENLPKAVTNTELEQQNRSAREILHIASAMAGVAITNSCTGLAHSYDHPGPAFQLPHGTVCGLMLPYTMKLCGSHPSYATIARRLGYNGDEAELSNQLMKHLIAFMKKLHLKTSFQELGINREDYETRMKEWAGISISAFATVVAPVEMTIEKGILLYEDCYYGRLNLV
ncbi:MAG: iron-containing alcohol dehydrogenase [Herbinix sp.]|jgi:alcohol dehydrogenase class IV|nr:iron-containing alcohol dehydrogenase [Herbinix sp.]